jgi:hypothetical protein
LDIVTRANVDVLKTLNEHQRYHSGHSKGSKSCTTNLNQVEEGGPIKNSAFTSTGADEPETRRSQPNCKPKEKK